MRLEKCRFFTENIAYLAHIINPTRLEVASHTSDTIIGLKTLTNLTELQSFLGLCSLFKCIVSSFARLPAHLNQRSEEVQLVSSGQLSEEESKFMEWPKTAIISPTVLSLPEGIEYITPDTDLCRVQVDCTLLRKEANEALKHTRYCSSLLTEAEPKYDTKQS